MVFTKIFRIKDLHVSLRDLSDMTQLLKVFRLKKIMTKIKNSNITMQDKAVFVIFFYMFLIVIYNHIVCCILWWFLKTDQLWVPPVEYGAFSLRIYFAEQVSLAPETDPEQQAYDLFKF